MSKTQQVNSKSTFASGFDPVNIVQVGTNGKGEPIVTYTSVYKGFESFHLRALYTQNGNGDVWFPGKGISLPMEAAGEILDAAVKSLAKAAKPAKAPRQRPQPQPSA